MHGLSPWFLGFGWVMLLLAQYWNRSRHHGGGVPWVLSVLWLATWVTLANTAIFGVEEGLVGHEEIVLGVNWPHLLQTGTAVTFLVLMAVNLSTVVGLGRVDLGMWSGRMLGARRWRAYALGHLVNLTVGLALAAGIAVLLSGLS